MDAFVCQNLDKIKEEYQVTDLVAQVIEANHLSKEEFATFAETVELDVSHFPDLVALKEKLLECKKKGEKIIVLSSNTLDNLFAVIILTRLFVVEKFPYTLNYLHRDSSTLKGNILSFKDQITFVNKEAEVSLHVSESYLSHSAMSYLISCSLTHDRYALGLADIGTVASDQPIIKENREIYREAKELLESQRYHSFERLLVSKEKRNNQILYNGGRNYTPYTASMIRMRFVFPLEKYLLEHSDKRYVGLLQYFFNPNKEGKKYQAFGMMLGAIKVDYVNLDKEPHYIKTDLELTTIDNIRKLDHTFEPYHKDFNRPHWYIEDVVVDEYRKFDMARGLELSFRTTHGLVKASAYDNECAHVKVNNGDHVSLWGTLSINGFSGLPMLHLKKLVNLSSK